MRVGAKKSNYTTCQAKLLHNVPEQYMKTLEDQPKNSNKRSVFIII